MRGEALGISRHRASGNRDLRGVGGSPQNSRHCCFSLHHAQLQPGSSHPTSWGHGKEPGLAQTHPRPLESNETRAAMKLTSQNPERHLKGTAGEVTVIVAKRGQTPTCQPDVGCVSDRHCLLLCVEPAKVRVGHQQNPTGEGKPAVFLLLCFPSKSQGSIRVLQGAKRKTPSFTAHAEFKARELGSTPVHLF